MQATGRNEYLLTGYNSDVVDNVVACYERWKNQPIEIVYNLRNVPAEEACEAIFSYLLDNVQYKADPDGVQYIKSPARLLKDRYGDCKSYSIFIAACLHCLNIPCKFRFVNFDNGNQYTHVYVIAKREDNQIIIIDPVERINEQTIAGGEPCFNYARPFSKCKDIIVY